VTSQGSMVYVARPDLPPFEEFIPALRDLWDSRILTNNGPAAQSFELELQKFLCVDFLDVLANGTLALQLAFRILPRRGNVLTTPFTFVGTTTALLWEGYTPHFVDINPSTFNLDVEKVRDSIGPDTVGVLAVHVFGNPNGASELAKLCREEEIPLIFDAAHAFGVTTEGGSILRLGDLSTLSFHATKSFHTLEGGAIVTDSREISRKVRSLRNFGIVDEENVELAGINAKMNEVQALVGRLNLAHYPAWRAARHERFKLYLELLGSTPGIEFQEVPAAGLNFTYMPILLGTQRDRDKVHDRLVSAGIKPRKYFFPATNDLNIADFKPEGETPIAREISRRVLVLPLFATLPEEVIHRVCTVVKAAIA
jgi:dTDP-4-amino-4,6-dideoxygalactose transaminase